jgi:hypothetical protein
MGLHDDGKTGGVLNSWGQYAKSGDIIFDVAGGLGGIALRTSSKVVGKVIGKTTSFIAFPRTIITSFPIFILTSKTPEIFLCLITFCVQ